MKKTRFICKNKSNDGLKFSEQIMKKVTIRDIAERCGVTPTVVSAVLNGSGRRSRCSAEKQTLIRKTAAEMNYQPNIFARSMVTRKVPLVLLMLHLDSHNIVYGSRYFAESVAGASALLNENGLEVTLVLYRDETEQIARFTELARKGLIGGVIAHVTPGHNGNFIRALLESKLPYVLQGETDIPAVSIMPFCGENNALYAEARKRYGAKKVFIHQAESGKDVLFPYYDIPGYSRFHYPPITPTPELTGDPENMIISFGYEYYLHLNNRMKIASPVVNERQKFEFLIPEGVPKLICEDAPDCISEAAKLLVQWQVYGKEPECKTHYVSSHFKTVLKWKDKKGEYDEKNFSQSEQ